MLIASPRTSLLIQLLQDLTDDLSHALQRLDVVLGNIEVMLQASDLLPQRLELRLPFPRV